MSSAPSQNKSPTRFRILSRSGSFNTDQKGLKHIQLSDLYHSLLAISWPRLLAFVGAFYLAINFFFGAAYFYLASDQLAGLSHESAASTFMDCFFFSVQTLATIGYGRISPTGLTSHLIVTLEALMGMLSLAVTTGLIFTRFARPTSKVIFSEKSVISLIDGVPHFLCRAANQRRNQIVGAEARMVLTVLETTKEGQRYRNFYDLKLERDWSPLFSLTWTIVHPIEKDSPLYGKSRADLDRLEAEVIVSLTGTDDTFSQPIHARFSYAPDDIFYDSTFVDILSRSPEGKMIADLERLHEIKPRV
ncbi:MAG: ion channel [Bdellovibrionota bacterium]